jgi:hypothetical protein
MRAFKSETEELGVATCALMPELKLRPRLVSSKREKAEVKIRGLKNGPAHSRREYREFRVPRCFLVAVDLRMTV